MFLALPSENLLLADAALGERVGENHNGPIYDRGSHCRTAWLLNSLYFWKTPRVFPNPGARGSVWNSHSTEILLNGCLLHKLSQSPTQGGQCYNDAFVSLLCTFPPENPNCLLDPGLRSSVCVYQKQGYGSSYYIYWEEKGRQKEGKQFFFVKSEVRCHYRKSQGLMCFVHGISRTGVKPQTDMLLWLYTPIL